MSNFSEASTFPSDRSMPATAEAFLPPLTDLKPPGHVLLRRERTLGRQKRREGRGKAEARGTSFPGTADHASERKQVFAAALKRVNTELRRLHNLALGPHMSRRLERLSRCIEPLTS